MKNKCKQPMGLCVIGRWAVALGIVCALVALGGCATTSKPLIFDENLPAEQSSRIYFGVQVTEYNGIPVPHKKKDFSHYVATSEWKYVYLPPGEIVFVVDQSVSDGLYRYNLTDAVLRYTFEPNTDYVVNFVVGSLPDDYKIAFVIHKMTYDEYSKEGRRHFARVKDFYALGDIVAVNFEQGGKLEITPINW
jgi:hypothetical protein